MNKNTAASNLIQVVGTLSILLTFYLSLFTSIPIQLVFGDELYPGELGLWGVVLRCLCLFLFRKLHSPDSPIKNGVVCMYALIGIYFGFIFQLLVSLICFPLLGANLDFWWETAKPFWNSDSHTASSHVFSSPQASTHRKNDNTSNSNRTRRRKRSKSPRVLRFSETPVLLPPKEQEEEEEEVVVPRVCQDEAVIHAKQAAREELDERTREKIAKLYPTTH